MRSTYLRYLLCLGLIAAAPSRTKTYTAGQIISPSDVTENENNIYSYLQSGVDTLATGAVTTTSILDGTIAAADLGSNAVASASIVDGTIVNADLSASAALAYSKLTLTNSILNADVNSSAAIAFSKLAALTSTNILVGNSSNVATSVAMSGDVAISNTGATTIQANSVALTTDTTGSYAAGDAEAGNATGLACTNCVAGTEIAIGSDAQGDIMYYDGTDWARLGAGTSGQFLKTQGAGANPVWAGGGMCVMTSTKTAGNATNTVGITGCGFTPRFCVGTTSAVGTGGGTQALWSVGVSNAAKTITSTLYDSEDVSADGGTDWRYSATSNVDANYQAATISSYDSDGISITWTLGGTGSSSNAQLTMMCFQ